LTVKIKGNRGAQQETCFNKSFKRNCTISTGIPNVGVRCKKMIQLDIRSRSRTKRSDSDSQCC